MAARRAAVPRIVHTYHGFPFHEFQSRGQRGAYIAIERRLGRVTDVVLCVGTGIAVEAVRRRLVAPERIRTIGVAVERGVGAELPAQMPGATRPRAPCSRPPRRRDRRRCRWAAHLPEGTRGFPGSMIASPEPGRCRRRLGRRRGTDRHISRLARAQPARHRPGRRTGGRARYTAGRSTYSCCQAVTRACPRR